MRILFDAILNDEIKNYLLIYDGIEKIDLIIKDFRSEINIKFNDKITPKIIKRYIYLFQNTDIPIMLEFDKCINKNCKLLKYVVDDMCCEYCYKNLIQELFDNEFIISAKSNFDFNKPAFNVELFIEYSDHYNENELVQYIKEKIIL